MNHEPIIPLSPEQTPVQNQEPKPALPSRPPGFQVTFEKPKGSGFCRMSPFATYLGQVEWASCPMGTRLDGYYISTNGRQTHWILWLKYYDDNWGRWNPPAARAFIAKGDIPRDVAAVWLLIEKWRLMARDDQLGRFSWVNESGLLSADELCAMRDVAWGAAASPKA